MTHKSQCELAHQIFVYCEEGSGEPFANVKTRCSQSIKWFELALEICDESSGELARINATNRLYTRFWFCDEGSSEPAQMCRIARALKSPFLTQMVIGCHL